MHDDLHRIADIVEIIEWLAHAHQNDVGQHATIGGVVADIVIFFIVRSRRHIALWPFAQRIARKHDLSDNFTGR